MATNWNRAISPLAHLMMMSETMASRLPTTSKNMAPETVRPDMIDLA